ncbi:hypothetical protein AWC38_SpisGene25808 [Stylophora pistillata]|uniref:CTCK domain-containing protein n=1 Tax=Stylophora pistillata TaxID=50429 RepID=A0A2B4RDT1_STYPI|nr:hypothetical protein AWC38_SpisGene25808 [Stylophora pistillata]
MKSKTLPLQAILILVLVTSHVWAVNFKVSTQRVTQRVHHKEVCKPWSVKVAVRVVDCQTRMVSLNQCAGTCLSEHSLNEESCKCCKPVKKSVVNVPLHCQDSSGNPSHYTHQMEQHEECSCLPCST